MGKENTKIGKRRTKGSKPQPKKGLGAHRGGINPKMVKKIKKKDLKPTSRKDVLETVEELNEGGYANSEVNKKIPIDNEINNLSTYKDHDSNELHIDDSNDNSDTLEIYNDSNSVEPPCDSDSESTSEENPKKDDEEWLGLGDNQIDEKEILKESIRIKETQMKDDVNELAYRLEREARQTMEGLRQADVLERIRSSAAVLSDISKKPSDFKRKDIVEKFKADLCTYYGYTEWLLNELYELFSPPELLEFLDASETTRPLTVRVNTLKTKRSLLTKMLKDKGMTLESIKWSTSGLVVYDSPVPVGATPEYLAGYYMIQSASSYLPVMALSPQPNEQILDMCAAPGGKTTHIAALMKNTGVLVACDVSKKRQTATIANIERMGITNACVIYHDSRKISKYFNNFDRILIDAPCTGTGVISKDKTVKVSKSQADIKDLYKTQIELILHAVDMVKSGGIIVYSTCSILPAENEHVITKALLKRPSLQVLDLDFEIGTPGLKRFHNHIYHPSLEKTRRLYPHKHNLDGFYIAKLMKR